MCGNIATGKYLRQDNLIKKRKFFKLIVLRAHSKNHGSGSSEGLKTDGRTHTGKKISCLQKEIKNGWDPTIPPKGSHL